jgi:hypothetical protein
LDALGLDDEVDVVITPAVYVDENGNVLVDHSGVEEEHRRNVPSVAAGRATRAMHYLEVKDIDDANSQVKGIPCKCVKTLEILGHGNVGFQNISSINDPDRETKGRIGVTDVSFFGGWFGHEWKAYGMELFEGIDFCSPCEVVLRGCKTSQGAKGNALLAAVSSATRCIVRGFIREAWPGRDRGLPGYKRPPHGPDWAYYPK